MPLLKRKGKEGMIVLWFLLFSLLSSVVVYIVVLFKKGFDPLDCNLSTRAVEGQALP
jgi:hypothetical protein